MTLTYIIDFKCLKYEKFLRFGMLPKAKNIFLIQQYSFQHLRSNGVNAIFSSATLIYILEVKIQNVYISEAVKASTEMSCETFVDFDICHRMV